MVANRVFVVEAKYDGKWYAVNFASFAKREDAAQIAAMYIVKFPHYSDCRVSEYVRKAVPKGKRNA